MQIISINANFIDAVLLLNIQSFMQMKYFIDKNIIMH
jgi:hypothetical protein